MSGGRTQCRCRVCGVEFTPKRSDRVTCCSRACGFELRRQRPRMAATSAVYFPACLVCGRTFCSRAGNVGLCSAECRTRDARRYARERSANAKAAIARKCRECGALFMPDYGDKRNVFCGRLCHRRAERRIAKGIVRARRHGVRVSERFDPVLVFERDGWACYLCGEPTPRDLRGTVHPRAPETDHVVPLSRGGAHSTENVRCCCRQCNQTKARSEQALPPPMPPSILGAEGFETGSRHRSRGREIQGEKWQG